MKRHHQAGIWQRELKRPPPEAVEAASVRMKETCEEPSGFCDLLVADACQCPDLARYLPNMIDLNHIFCKNINGPRSAPLIMANPIHALHMSSQLEENSTIVDQSFRPMNMVTSPWMYGEEQQRTIAFSQAGVASGFFPLTKNHIFHQFNSPNPDAPKPLHAAGSLFGSSKSSKKSSPSNKKDSPSKSKSSSPSTKEPTKKKAKTSSSASASSPTTSTATAPPSLEHRHSVSFASPLAIVQKLEASKSTDEKDSPEKGTFKKEGQNTTETSVAGEKVTSKDVGEALSKNDNKADSSKTKVEMSDAASKKDGKKTGENKNSKVGTGTQMGQGDNKGASRVDAAKASKEAKEGGDGGAKKKAGIPVKTEKPTEGAKPAALKPSPEKQAVGSPSFSSPSSATKPPSVAKLPPTKGAATSKPEFLLSEARYIEISRQEEQIKVIRNLLAKRQGNIKKKSKKRKLESQFHGLAHSALQNLPGSLQYNNERAVVDMDRADRDKWMQEKATANRMVEVWLEQFRSSRRTFWKEQATIQQQQQQKGGGRGGDKPKASINFSEWSTEDTLQRTCQLCPKSKQCQVGDQVMQCLECGFVGCSPVSVAPQSKNQHILQHLFLSGHKFAVTCGIRAEIFSFPSGDFVYHRLFDQERERLDLEARIPWLGWKDHPLVRSFDPLQFAQVEEYGIVWRGLMATYPPLVPQEHVDAAKLSVVRQAVFEGRVMESHWMIMGRRPLDFAIHQNKSAPEDRYRIPAPIGMYNLGQTCFMSAILQCLVHCVPLQRYFLKDIGHHHKACEKYRHMDPNNKSKDAAEFVCLACEMDSLMLQYYSRSTGRDVVAILKDLSATPRRSVMDLLNEISSRDEECIEKGEPIIPSRMLHVAWKSGGMGHLAGYEQRDAHEFLQAFLDILGKQICNHRARVDAAIALAQAGSRFKRQQEQVHHDVIKHLFEGTLRSVLVCEECGTKRTLSEPFLNVSLPLLKELMVTNIQSAPGVNNKLSLSRCLQHFTAPEKLADPVACPACAKKTPTKKQHTFSKLPKVLCIHLKRFHAALNKKIEDFVAFPASGLNMGPHLPHWREVTTVEDKTLKEGSEGSQNEEPQILYDLFGTVNHQGTLQSGHYTAHTKVGDRWYRINDQHVSNSDEAAVLTSEGAYILFYARR